MAKTKPDLFDTYAGCVSRPYVNFLQRLGIAFEPAEASGAIITDTHGRTFIDCIGGYGNVNIGHNHPLAIEALISAARTGRPSGWPFISEAHVQLAQKLTSLATPGLDRCLIVNTGAEAVESAIKLARLATGRAGIICCSGAWHGFTMGALSISEPQMSREFEPLIPGILRVPFGDASAVEAAISPEIAAVILEPIQCESGVKIPAQGYLKDLSAICKAAGALLIVDEIKTGMGKTGKMFACQFDPVEPDILLLGKSLGAGLTPIAALIARSKCWTKFGLSFAMSSSSSSGNAIACAIGIATLSALQSEGLTKNAESRGRWLLQELYALVRGYPHLLKGVTGRGLLLGLSTASARIAHEMIADCVRRGVLMAPAFLDRSCILLEPPLCIDESQVDQVSSALGQACKTFTREH